MFNVITKSGSNDFRGDVFGYYADGSWVSERIGRSQKGTSFAANRTDSLDFGLSLGGPIMKDRLWFFGAYNPSRRTTDVGEAVPLSGDPATEFDQDTDFYAAKLTYAFSPNHNIVGPVFGDPTPRKDGSYEAERSRGGDRAALSGRMWAATLQLQIQRHRDQSWLVEANLGRHHAKPRKSRSPTAASCSAPSTRPSQAASGAADIRFQNDQSSVTRTPSSPRTSSTDTRSAMALDVEKNDYTADLNETWYRWFGDRIQERIYSVAGAGERPTRPSSFRINSKSSNLQLNLGVRTSDRK